MAKQPSKRKNKKSPAPPQPKGQAQRAMERMDALHKSADDLHKQSHSMHIAAKATRARVQSVRTSTRLPGLGGSVSKLPPPGPAADRVEPTKAIGAPTTDALQVVDVRPSALPFSVVGIGSSAGGFEAIMDLVSHLPKDLNMAVVIVPHLDPSHVSRLADLLAPKSPLPVVEIRHAMQAKENTVYVLPANAAVLLEGTRFRLKMREPHGIPMPIDLFFRSLAVTQQNRAIGIVLSGTGSDGTLGLQEIKAQGGLTFAQDKGTAKHFGMPGSAVSAGAVDFVLAPESMAKELERLADHPYIAPARDVPPVEAIPAENVFKEHSEEIKSLFAILRTRTNVDFSLYKPGTLNRRILRRMALHKLEDLPDYLALLQEQSTEVEALFNDLLISVTGFFRDGGFYDALKNKILPRVLKNRPQDVPLRVWSCGCATGEEAYSLAIVIAEYLDQTRNPIPVQIFASDLNEKGIEKARSGLYHENILIDVTPERLRRFFVKVDSHYQIIKGIRDMCTFARQNVVVDPPFSNLDLVSCRNVLIYLAPVLQRRIMPIFHYALKPGGFMLLGSSETTGDSSELFELFDKKNKIYTKKITAYRPAVDLERGFVPPRLAIPTAPKPAPAIPDHQRSVESSLQQRVDRLILNEFSPTAVVINSQMDILQFRGRTSPFIEHQSGAASLHLLKVVRDDLMLDVRRSVNKAIRTGERSAITGEMRTGGTIHEVHIEVRPLPPVAGAEPFFLVTFREISAADTEAKLVGVSGRSRASGEKLRARQMTKIREELAATRESLQSIIEEQDATNEELKSANEEIQSSNEELQSTNEELETAREELQSTNEELTTLNQELQSRNAELAQVNNDLTNLLSSVNIAIIMLGTDFKIRRFTPMAEKVFNLIPSDVGRKLNDLNRKINVPDLDEAIEDVIDRLAVVDREVQDDEGRWYSLRIRPYRTRESRIEGVVLILLDIDEFKRSIKNIISLAREPLIALGPDLTVTRINDPFCRAFQVTPELAEGKSVFELADNQWNIPRLRQLLEDLLPRQGEVRDFRLEHEFPNLGKRTLVINARRFYEESRGLQLVLLAIEDVT